MDTLLVTTVLSALGLSAPEIAVYTELLAIGAQPASVAAKKAKLKRGHTYNVLGELTHKGLVQEFTKSGVRYFSAAPPQTLLSILANRQDELDLRRREILTVIWYENGNDWDWETPTRTDDGRPSELSSPMRVRTSLCGLPSATTFFFVRPRLCPSAVRS